MASPRLSGFIVDRSDVNHVIAITGGDKSQEKGPTSFWERGPWGCLEAMGSERLQRFPNTPTHHGWLVRIDMLTQWAGQAVCLSEPRRWFVPGRRCCGYWNYLATVRAVDCDVPLVRLNGFTHRLPQMMSTLQRCIE